MQWDACCNCSLVYANVKQWKQQYCALISLSVTSESLRRTNWRQNVVSYVFMRLVYFILCNFLTWKRGPLVDARHMKYCANMVKRVTKPCWWARPTTPRKNRSSRICWQLQYVKGALFVRDTQALLVWFIWRMNEFIECFCINKTVVSDSSGGDRGGEERKKREEISLGHKQGFS